MHVILYNQPFLLNIGTFRILVVIASFTSYPLVHCYLLSPFASFCHTELEYKEMENNNLLCSIRVGILIVLL